MVRGLVIVADCSPNPRIRERMALRRAFHLLPPDTTSCTVVNFSDVPDADLLTHADGVHVESVIPGGPLIESTAGDTHAYLCQYVHDVGVRWQKRQAAESVYEWWYNAVSEKNVLAHPEWAMTFRLFALRSWGELTQYSRIVVVGDGLWCRGVQSLVREGAADADVSIVSLTNNAWLYTKELLRRVVGGVSLFGATVVAQCFRARNRQQVLRMLQVQPKIAAFSWYPRSWAPHQGAARDKYYADILRDLRDAKHHVVNILRCYDSRSYVRFDEMLRRYRLLWSDPACRDSFILDAEFRILDVVRCYLNFRSMWSYGRLRRTAQDRATCDTLSEAVDDLLRRVAWRSSCVELPVMQVLERATMRTAQKCQCRVYMLYCFEFIYGRAIVHGLRTAGAESVAVLQHGPMTAMKLLYSGQASEFEHGSMPSPLPLADSYIVDSSGAERLLLNRGVPELRIQVLGPARLDHLTYDERKGTTASSIEGRDPYVVLVAPGLHDTAQVVRCVVDVLHDQCAVRVLIRPHPKVGERRVRHIIEKALDGRKALVPYEIVASTSFASCCAQADLFVATYSTVAIEAVFYGVPVVQLMANSIPDMGLFADSEVPVQRVWECEELRDVVQRYVRDPQSARAYLSALNPIVDHALGPCDGRAASRIAQHIATLADSPCAER